MDRGIPRTGALLGLFLGSGCAALIYEIVWFQQLSLVLGATSVSLAILLTSFMGGMCLGSLVYPRVASDRRHPLRDYASLELLIGGYGLASLVLLPTIGQVYWSFGSPGSSDLPLRAVVALAMLLPPTMLMGATLPAVSRGVATNRSGLSRLGLFYGANTFGAVAGSLFAGLYLLRVHDVIVATIVAAAINALVALVAWSLSRSPCGGESLAEASIVESSDSREAFSCRTASWVLGLSGLTAMGAEVVWTRLLGLLFGSTTYTFSILLAVFLGGLGIGSCGGSWLARRARRPGVILAVAQLLLLIAIPFAAFVIVVVLPWWLSTRDPALTMWMRMARDVVRASAALLPATVLWGASFPLGVATAANGQPNAARLVGRLYAANTLGAIVGALGISLVASPWGGSHFAQQLLTYVAGIAGALMLAHELVRAQTQSGSWRSLSAAIAALICVGASFTASLLVPPTPAGLLAYGNDVDYWAKARQYLFVREGLDSAIAVVESEAGYRCFHVSGRCEATNSPSDMRTQRLLGHLPAAAHPQPKKVLVIGCGSGMTGGAFLTHPSVEEIVLCEIEPVVVEANRVHFAEYNGRVLDDPRTRIVFDDARHFLATARETFDIITTDPIHPWIRGSASLYTREFFELCRRKLNPDGVVTQWIPLYESNVAAVKCELATLLQVFPEALIFNGESQRSGYDLVVVGTVAAEPPNIYEMSQRLFFDRPRVAASLAEIGWRDRNLLLRTLVGRGDEIIGWLADAQINRDGNLRLQYLAGLTPDAHTETNILREVIAARQDRQGRPEFGRRFGN